MTTQPTSLSRMPREIRDKIVALRDGGRTIHEIVAALDAIDVKTSKSAVHRVLQKEAKVADRLRRTRELAQSIGRQFGDTDNSTVARANIELLHDALMGILSAREDDEELSSGDVMKLAIAAEKLTKASKTDFEKELKAALEMERRQTKEAAAQVAVEAAKKRGISAETAQWIKAEILGVEGA